MFTNTVAGPSRALSSSRHFLMCRMLGLMALTSPIAHADVIFNVNTTADQVDLDVADGLCLTGTGTCSLRAAIMQANHLSGPVATHINLPAGVYLLTRPASGADGEDSGDLNLTAPSNPSQTVFIDGIAASSTIIDANQIDRVVTINSGRTVSLSRLTLRNGFVAGDVGGGVLNMGSLTLQDCIVEGNTSDAAGGGIYSSGVLQNRRSTLRANIGYLGGAVFVRGTVRLQETSLYGNHALRDGGAIAVVGPPLPGNLYLINSTISGNSADTDGGGIRNQGTAYIYSSSIINNDADHDRDQQGGIGGGVQNNSGARFVSVNSLIADNTILDAPIFDDCNGALEVYGWNLLGTFDGCSFLGDGNAARGSVSRSTIGPLQDNGGPTLTHALLAGSEAIDTTTAQGCIDDAGAALGTDQRGALRVAGLRCDVGSFEYGAIADLIFRHGFEGGM